MKCIKKSKKKDAVWRGTCRACKSAFEAIESELKTQTCPREHYRYAYRDCSECGAKGGMAIIFYPKGDE